MASGNKEARKRRHSRLRKKIVGTTECPRLCVFRSIKHIYAQVVDDSLGKTVVEASTLDNEVKDKPDSKTKKDRAALVGNLVGERAKSKGITKIVFDRGGYQYHGRIKALAEAARESGLRF